jgi:diacylglycerol kinase family enzyme
MISSTFIASLLCSGRSSLRAAAPPSGAAPIGGAGNYRTACGAAACGFPRTRMRGSSDARARRRCDARSVNATAVELRRPRALPARHVAVPRSVVLIANPNASGSRRFTLAARAVSALRRAGVRVDARVTSSIDELREIFPRDPERRVVLVGGDGTVHVVANLPGPLPEVALIPAGSANNVCRSLGIPLDLEAAAALAATGRARPIDLVEARTDRGRYVVTEGVSVGFLARARTCYQAPNSADSLAAVRAGAEALATFHPLGVRVTAGRVREELRLAQLFVANLPLYAFGLHVAPQADPEDATLDLVGIERSSRATVLAMLLELRRGTLLRHPGVHVWRARTATISTHGTSPIVADSTDLGCGPVRLEVLRAALPLVRP